MLDERILTFLELCRCKSFTQTAEKLHITQPTVSQRIRALEGEYNVKLVEYRNRKFSLTNSGERLYYYALSAKISSDMFIQDIGHFSRKVYPLRLGVVESAAESFVPKYISEYIKSHPKLRIIIIDDNSSALQSMMEDNEIDLIITDRVFSGANYEIYTLFNSEVVCACSPRHPLAGKNVELSELIDQRIILRPDGTPAFSGVNAYLQQYNYSVYQFKSVLEVNSFAAARLLLLQDAGICFFNRCLIMPDIDDGLLKTIHITTPLAFKGVDCTLYYLIRRKNAFPSQEQQEFVEYCLDAFRKVSSFSGK